MNKVYVIGAGLAGCEAAYYLAKNGVKVTLFEQKPIKRSPAHHIDTFAELVCSNSLKAMRVNSAGGLLKAEMREFGSICLESADKCAVPAGGALAVNRYDFSNYITEKIKNLHQNANQLLVFPSLKRFFFLFSGTGSYPPRLKGLQRKIRQTASAVPLKIPNRFKASTA